MSKSDGMAPGLSPEDQARARAAMENLRRRHEEGMYRGRPAIPEKTDSMVPGISVVRPAPGPPVPFDADGEEEEDDVTTDPGEAALRFLRALERLPPYTGIVFHGLPSVPSLAPARWTRGVTATSRDPRIATENFSTPVVVAIVSRTGRDISFLSAQQAEQEVVLPPETVLLEVARTTLDDGRPVVIAEQLADPDPAAALPPTLDDLVAHVRQTLHAARAQPAVAITTPGKFVEPLFFLTDGDG